MSRNQNLFTILAFLIGIAGIASTAGAVVTYTSATSVSSGRSLDQLEVGDLVTIDITLRRDFEGIFGLGAAAAGYDRSVVAFSSGTAVASVLNQVCLPEFDLCAGGLDNQRSGALSEDLTNPLGPHVPFLEGVTLTPVQGDGSADFGVGSDGESGAVGDPQFQLVFRAAGVGSTSIDMGAQIPFGLACLPGAGASGLCTSNNTTVSLTVIPEPGVVVLLGVGLLYLAANRHPRATAKGHPL